MQLQCYCLVGKTVNCMNVSGGVPRLKVVRGVKPLVYRRWKLRHVTLVKWVKTIASIRTTHCHSFDKMQNVLTKNSRGDNSTIIS